MDDRQKYLFDVRGYLELDDVLTRDQCRRLVDEMKRLIDVPDDEKPEGVSSKDEPTQASLGDLTSAGAEFCALIDIPRVIDVLKAIIHHELRLEISYGYIRRKGFPGLPLHGGGEFDSNGQDLTLMYRQSNGRIFSGHTVVAFNLTDVDEEEGGFACVPGSHKANFPIPEEMKTFEHGVDGSLIRCVPCRAGSAVIFTEALCHGAAPWDSDRERPVLQVPPRRHEVSPLLPQPLRAGAHDAQPAFLLHRGRLRPPRRAPVVSRPVAPAPATTLLH